MGSHALSPTYPVGPFWSKPMWLKDPVPISAWPSKKRTWTGVRKYRNDYIAYFLRQNPQLFPVIIIELSANFWGWLYLFPAYGELAIWPHLIFDKHQVKNHRSRSICLLMCSKIVIKPRQSIIKVKSHIMSVVKVKTSTPVHFRIFRCH